MSYIDQTSCTGCKVCLLFCPDDAIEYYDGKCSIDSKQCTLCGCCEGCCPFSAIYPTTNLTDLQIFQQTFGDPRGSKVTGGNAGRGGKEIKTLDVKPTLKPDHLSICLDMGRPSVGLYLRDAEKIIMALMAAGMEFAEGDFPLSTIIPDRTTGKFRPDCLDIHMHSLLTEGCFHKSKLPGVLQALKDVSTQIDTVLCPGLIFAVNENIENEEVLRCLDEQGIPRPVRSKINVGLGKPFSPDLSKNSTL
ncbi:indolepyruvate ferredoxin oxidoreductase subunit alpha [Escherichia albertii]|uniref:indolepyruvate ferredoxin oxidoreductase subunit alpha n=1 Tax=Escherichia albertii TaxID=208962 RepID=UPI0007440E4A|nr:4Fe-4S binding protein [Escherichia albertii]